jgi:hypothetical protein
MKILVGVSFAIMLGLGAASSCAIDHASDALACTKTSQCTDGRNCVGGFCVVGNGSGSGSGSCPGQCSTCDTVAKTCSIDGNNVDGDRVTCPTGFHCTITCTGGTCKTVDCSNAASCSITCSGQQSCESVNCGVHQCAVTCSGQESCASVTCQSSCGCDVQCTGQASCGTGAQCPLGCDTGLGCTAQTVGCNVCL